MVIFVIDLFTRLNSIIILTMLLVVVKMHSHEMSASCGMIRKTWKAFLSPYTFFFDQLSYNTFLYNLISGNKCRQRHIPVILRHCIYADHSLDRASVRIGHEMPFSNFLRAL